MLLQGLINERTITMARFAPTPARHRRKQGTSEEARKGHPMKNNAHLYWPPSLIEEYLVSIGVPKVQPDRQPAASVEQLDGGCFLYRLAPQKRSA